jgi:hypothetical protein
MSKDYETWNMGEDYVKQLLTTAAHAPNEWDRRRGKKSEDHAGTCAICGEACYFGDDIGEMHHPDNPEELGGIVHAQCGLDQHWVMS